MYDDATLLPSAHVIHERLSRNSRERHRLHVLLRLVRHAEEDQPHEIQVRQPGSPATPEKVAP
jgi:hypothetical protein